jgi:hypothetical protein
MLLGAVALAPWPYGSATDAARFALTAWLLFACALWALGRQREGRAPRGLAWALAVPALGLAQIALRTSAAPVFTAQAVLVWAAMGGVLVVASECARDRRFALVLGATVVAVCSAEALFAVVQWAAAPGTIYGRRIPIVTSASGSFVNHNHFAGLVEMGALLALGWALGLVRRAGGPTPGALVLSGLGAALIAAHLASGSRGGLAALAGGVLTLGLLWWGVHSRGRPSRRFAVTALLLALAAVLAFGWLAVPSTTRRHLATILRGSAETSGAYRLDMAAATLRLWASRPWLGSGLGAYGDAVAAMKRGYGDSHADHAEDDVLEFAAEAGIAGFVIAGSMLFVLGSRCVRRLRARGDPVRRGLALGALAGVAALAIHSFFDFNLRLPANALVCAVLAALAAAPLDESQAGARRWTAAAFATLFVVLGAAAAWRASGAAALAQALQAREPYARFVALSEVVHRHPEDAVAWRQRARARLAAWSGSGSALAVARLERAASDLDQALRLRPLWGEAWGDLGWVYWRRGDIQRARAAFERATRVDPTHRWVGLTFIHFLEAHGEAEAAAAERARLASTNPGWDPRGW